MGKMKGTKAGDSIPHKHLHSRISFLHQAATYLSTTTIKSRKESRRSPIPGSSLRSVAEQEAPAPRPQTHYLLSQLRGISKKSQSRLGRDMKHTFCKKCDSLLIPGQTSLQKVMNDSRKGGKPWADVFEVRCTICQKVKRFPVASRKIQVPCEQPHTASKRRQRAFTNKHRPKTAAGLDMEGNHD